VLHAPETAELNQRALRVIHTRLNNLFGTVSSVETTRLLALELSEVGNRLGLIGAIAATGAVAVILASRGVGVEPEQFIAEIRAVKTPLSGDT
jgi:hypothetical protein